jgi:hypothetical protein
MAYDKGCYTVFYHRYHIVWATSLVRVHKRRFFSRLGRMACTVEAGLVWRAALTRRRPRVRAGERAAGANGALTGAGRWAWWGG